MSSYADLLRRMFPRVLNEPREACMDGELHVEGECCGENRIMGRVCACGGRLHQQPVYGGIADLCERCPRDESHWYPLGYHPLEPGYTARDACAFVDWKQSGGLW